MDAGTVQENSGYIRQSAGRNLFHYKGATVWPEHSTKSVFVACNKGVNRYLKDFWRIVFPDDTYCRIGTKAQARQYIDAKGHSHGVSDGRMVNPFKIGDSVRLISKPDGSGS